MFCLTADVIVLNNIIIIVCFGLGVAADLSHICSKPQVKGFVGEDQLTQALEGAEVVVIPAGVPRKPGKWGSNCVCVCVCVWVWVGVVGVWGE